MDRLTVVRPEPDPDSISSPTTPATARRLVAASVSANTRDSYSRALRQFDTWRGRRPLDDSTLAAYLAVLYDSGRSPSVAAVRFRARLSDHPDPAGKATGRVLAGFRRTAADHLSAVLATCHRPRKSGRGIEAPTAGRSTEGCGREARSRSTLLCILRRLPTGKAGGRSFHSRRNSAEARRCDNRGGPERSGARAGLGGAENPMTISHSAGPRFVCATAPSRVAENNYRSLTDKCREEFRVRQQVLEGLQSERRTLLSLAVIAGAVGALGAGLTTQAARWLWDTFLAILSAGWTALAAWQLRNTQPTRANRCSRSACIANGRLRYTGTGAVRTHLSGLQDAEPPAPFAEGRPSQRRAAQAT